MRKRSILFVLVTVGCGRIGFGSVTGGDGASDGGDPDSGSLQACNTGIDLGPPSQLFGSQGGEQMMATAVAGTRILVAFTTAGGLVVAPIEMAVDPPVLGAATSISTMNGTNVQITVSGQRVMATMGRNGGTEIVMTDLALQTINDANDPGITVTAPDHSVPDGNGAFIVASTDASSARMDIVSAAGIRGGGASWSLVTPRGASMSRLGTNQFIEVTDTLGGSICNLRIVDAALGDVHQTVLSSCAFPRVAATLDAATVGVAYYDQAQGVRGQVYSADLITAPATQLLLGGHFEPARLVADASGFWAIAPITAATLQVRHLAADGTAGILLPITPFATMMSSFQHDVVTVGGQAYAVWLDAPVSPRLHIERLCPQ